MIYKKSSCHLLKNPTKQLHAINFHNLYLVPDINHTE